MNSPVCSARFCYFNPETGMLPHCIILMDPIWYGLSEEDCHFLDGREEMEIRTLYPVTLMVPDLFRMPVAVTTATVEIRPENGIGKSFYASG